MTVPPDLGGYPSTVVWRLGDRHRSEWLMLDTSNPFLHLFWSYSKWGRKLLRGAWSRWGIR